MEKVTFKSFLKILILVSLIFKGILFSATAQISFNSSNLNNLSIANPTTLQFGPDGKLYVGQQDGTIKVLTVTKSSSGNYTVTASQTISLVRQIPNHFDDGTPKPYNISTNKRQVTGLHVAGTASNPVIYTCSSDNDIGAGSNGDKDLCTNSGVLSKLTWNGTTWTKVDLVRGIPRSEENHAPNGIEYDEQKNMIFIPIGGLTNAGAPSRLFAYITEYALSACILSVDLNYIDALPLQGTSTAHPYKYDMPTLDDPTRANTEDGKDINDPWGGNDGLNQSKIIPGGPVQVYAPGLRNPYDVVITRTPGKARRLYTIDNGANPNWGGYPDQEGPQGTATNKYLSAEPGSTTAGTNDAMVNNLDNLHYIGNLDTYVPGSFYGGHPCPVRANPAGAGLYTHSGTLDAGTGVWRTSKNDPVNPLPADWPPVPLDMANPIEGDFQNPGVSDNALITFNVSTNGVCEYTASNFGGALKGNLLAVGFDGNLFRIKLSDDGKSSLNSRGASRVNQDMPLASGFGTKPLDVTAQADDQVFPGTIWVANYSGSSITVFEPVGISCTPVYNTSDSDGDGYTNADEIDNNTDPCSAASKPLDNDKDLVSDLKDTDDDNDNLADTADPFALDPANGMNTNIPVSYSLFNNDPGTGLFGLGFTGLMTNGTSDYTSLFDESHLIAGGAAGALTIDQVPAGDALGGLNTQKYGFQFGVNVNAQTAPFYVRTILMSEFFKGTTPQNYQSEGLFIGTGDQDNYFKIVFNANGGAGGFEVVSENQGVASSSQFALPKYPTSSVELIIAVNPSNGTVKVKAATDGGNLIQYGGTFTLAGPLLTALQSTSKAIAVGFISTSRGASAFNATWDIIEVLPDPSQVSGNWTFQNTSDGSTCTSRHENSFVECGDRFYLVGGRGNKPVQAYDPIGKTWKNKVSTPFEMNHMQAVSLNGLIYVVAAFTGPYPDETPIPDIWIFDPAGNKWYKGPSIPENRRRGSAGVVVRNNKIYIAGGIINGHQDGWVKWFDEFDPSTGAWKVLPDAPRTRDHFHAGLVNNKMYLAGGRRTSGIDGHVFNYTVSEVDVYDFSSGTWSTISGTIPTPRAGCTAVTTDDELIIIGGESMAHTEAHNETEALNVGSGSWRTLKPLNQGRHGTQGIHNNGGIYIACGNATRGGGAELTSLESFYFGNPTLPLLTNYTPGKLSAPAEVKLGSAAIGTTVKDTILFQHSQGNQAVIITGFSVSDSLFGINIPASLPLVINPGSVFKVFVSKTITDTLYHEADFVLTTSAGNIPVKLKTDQKTTQPPAQSDWSPLYFINSGGPSVSGVNTWSEDSDLNPSPYTNSNYSQEKLTTFTGQNTTDAPTAVFNSYRSDGGVKGDALSKEMNWKFPVQPGVHKIALYFNEYSSSNAAVGKRIFDIMVEGVIVENNFDIYATAGFNKPVKKEYQVNVTDNSLDIVFIHEVENPVIHGLAIFGSATSNPPASFNVSVLPGSLTFDNIVTGTTSASKSVTVTNNGSSTIHLTQVILQGTDASQFKTTLTTAVAVAAGTSQQVSLQFAPLSTGLKSGEAVLKFQESSTEFKVALTGTGVLPPPQVSDNITLTSPQEGAQYMLGDSVKITADVVVPFSGASYNYLKVTCPDTKFRKLKLGYSTSSLYTPKVNVTAGGNNTIEIVLKSVTASIPWTKIQIRPQGVSTNAVNLSTYIAAATSEVDNFKRIRIPLSAFTGVDFTQIANLEFPYSAGAGIFEIHLKSVEFTGGSTPLLWFGGSKTNNIHDGLGGSGQLNAELVTGNTSGKTITQVEFLNGTTVLGTDAAAPWQFTWTNLAGGQYTLYGKVKYSDGTSDISAGKTITVKDPRLTVKLKFSQTPSSVTVTRAPLRYDKDFAYSFTLDDGKIDGYTHALPLLEGGTISSMGKTYPGLYFTDGCGNRISFKGGLAWNSYSTTLQDIHTNTPGYITWTQMKEMYNRGWNVFNHSLTHAGGAGTDYNFQINENQKIIRQKSGLDPKHFVIPSGDSSYASYAFNSGMVAVYNQSIAYLGVGGLKVDALTNMNRIKINREFIYDKYDTTNVFNILNTVAGKSVNGAHYWYNEFTHRVDPVPSGGSLKFSTFEFYMNYIAQKYGENGKDNVWFAPLEDVYNYLQVRNNIIIETSLNGDILTMVLDTTNLPGDFRNYALTLKIASAEDFTVVSVNGFSGHSSRGSGANKILNLEWKPAETVSSSLARIAGEETAEPYVIYRLNAGGENTVAGTGDKDWQSDSKPDPSLYLATDPNVTTVNGTGNLIVVDHTIPAGTPEDIFRTERSLAWEGADSLNFRFPVSHGGEVEVRLYFAETEFEETNKRVFDIAVEDKKEIPSYDIFADAGKNKGVVKKFKATSDGAININLIRIKNNPSVRGIEILCLNNRCNTNDLKFSRNDWNRRKPYSSAYPNPFADKLVVDFSSELPDNLMLKLFNSQGDHIRDLEVSMNKGSEMELDFSNLPVGIYFLKIVSNDKVSETIKIVKQ
jgi:hypothetical protein